MPKGATPARQRAAHLGPERRRPLVLDAALRLFVERGYAGTSMEAIAEASGVTKPVVYECYPSKDELFRALLEREEQRLLDMVGSALPTAPSFDDIEKLLADSLSAFLGAAASAPDSWRVVFDSNHGGADAEVVDRVQRGRRIAVSQLSTLVEAYLRTTSDSDAEKVAPVLAEMLAASAEAMARVIIAGESGMSADELATMVARLAVRGVGAATGGVSPS